MSLHLSIAICYIAIISCNGAKSGLESPRDNRHASIQILDIRTGEQMDGGRVSIERKEHGPLKPVYEGEYLAPDLDHLNLMDGWYRLSYVPPDEEYAYWPNWKHFEVTGTRYQVTLKSSPQRVAELLIFGMHLSGMTGNLLVYFSDQDRVWYDEDHSFDIRTRDHDETSYSIVAPVGVIAMAYSQLERTVGSETLIRLASCSWLVSVPERHLLEETEFGVAVDVAPCDLPRILQVYNTAGTRENPQFTFQKPALQRDGYLMARIPAGTTRMVLEGLPEQGNYYYSVFDSAGGLIGSGQLAVRDH